MESGFNKIFVNLNLEINDQDSPLVLKDRFNKARNDEERVSIVLNHLTKSDLLPFKTTDERDDVKSALKSIALCRAGNECFIEDPAEAFLLYTKSIAVAPYPLSTSDKSEELAIAFASRSGLLFINKNYRGCLSDIEQALLYDYPANLMYKLYERQGKCYQKLGNISEAMESFKVSIAHLPLATSLPENVMMSVNQNLETLLVVAAESLKDETPDFDDIKVITFKTHGQHNEIACASDSLSFKQNVQKGRYVEAATDIAAGDILIVEEPFGSSLWPRNFYTHCFNCMKRFDALLPCTRCATVMYCSDHCRKVSWNGSHNIECPLLSHILKYDSGEKTSLVIRILLMGIVANNGLKNHHSYITDMYDPSDNNVIYGFDEGSPYMTSDIHFLMRNTEKRSFEDLLKFATVSACVVNCLEVHSDIFRIDENQGGCSKYGDMDSFRFVGGLVMRYLQIVSCNAYTVTDFMFGDNGSIEDQPRVGAAVYPMISWINHSCAPNITSRYELGNLHTVMAIQSIKRGEEIFVSYHHNFMNCDLEKRKYELQSIYFFTCHCNACVNVWPMYHYYPMDPSFLCSKCHSSLNVFPDSKLKRVICLLCKKKNDITELELKVVRAYEVLKFILRDLTVNSDRNYLKDIAQITEELRASVEYPSRVILKCEEAMRMNFMQGGNFVRVSDSRVPT